MNEINITQKNKTIKITQSNNNINVSQDINQINISPENRTIAITQDNNIIEITQVGGVIPNIIFDTEENLLNSNQENGTVAFSTDTNKFFVYQDNQWFKSNWRLVEDSANPDIGLIQDSSRLGYNEDAINNKRLSNVSIGSNDRPITGSVRTVFAKSLGRYVFQSYLDGEWKTILTGVNISTDETERPADIEFKDFNGWNISLISGNSDTLDPSGVPMVNNMSRDIGLYQSEVVIDGGSF